LLIYFLNILFFKIQFFNNQKIYANKQINQKSKTRPLWSKHVFLVILVKTFLGNQKKDIYKCPKSVFPKRSWKKEKYVIIHFLEKWSKIIML